jgi:hypothetical protein
MSSDKCLESRTPIAEARDAVCAFLRQSLPDASRVHVIRLLPLHAEDLAWEAEAMVWQPNVLLQSLGLATEHPVLEQEVYVVRLDRGMNVVSYGVKEAE